MQSSERIGELLFKYLREELSPEEALELGEWKTASPENEKQFIELTDPENLRRDLKEMYDHKKEIWKKIVDKAPELHKNENAALKWLRPVLAVAAVLVIVLVIGFAWMRNSSKRFQGIAKEKVVPYGDISAGTNKAVLILATGSKIMLDSIDNGQVATNIIKQDSGSLVYNAAQGNISGLTPQVWNTLETPRGGQFKLTLADGTKVWLNAASSLKYPVVFTGKDRLVLLSGEAYFEVAKNPEKPFRVKINERSEVEVLGTHFNIMGYKDEMFSVTTLLEGKVQVAEDSMGTLTVIKPGQQALVSGLHVQVKNNVDTEGVVSWKNGITSFSDADIKSIMRKVSRWYDVDISYNGEIPEHRIVGGIPRQASLSEVIKVLSLYVHCSLIGKRIIVSP